MQPEITGRVAIVTGAGRGIGRAIAKALAAEGVAVVATARTMAEIEGTADTIRKDGGRAIAIAVDVAEHEAVVKLIDNVLAKLGRIDVLVNNAGIQGPIGPLAENDWQAWHNNVAVNLLGTFNCCQAVLAPMMAQTAGRIINLSGGGATGPRPNFSAYSASKAAIVRLTETLAEEVQGHNVQVNAIAPGAVNTRMLDEVLQAGTAAGAELSAAQEREREGGVAPQVAASLAVFLALHAPPSLTGKLIAAPYDKWATWDDETIDRLTDSSWLTLRRLDPYTLSALAPGQFDGLLEDVL